MTTDFATAAGHWYGLDGSPRYTIIGKNGKERNTTLRDARELQLVPSVTTIIRCAAAPALENWKVDQGILAALTLPRMPNEPEAEWLKRVKQDSQEQAKKAAARGTEIHGAIERHFRGQPPDPALFPWVKAAVAELDKLGGGWNSERSFAHPLGYGGKTDLWSFQWVIDFKGKEGELPDKLYDEHEMQLAAYRRGVGVVNARCGILFFARDRPEVKFVESFNLFSGLAMFDSLLAYWQAKTGYRPTCAMPSALEMQGAA
jgi:hypothetical protein